MRGALTLLGADPGLVEPARTYQPSGVDLFILRPQYTFGIDP